MNLSSKKVKKCKTVGCDCFRWGSFQLCYKHYREKLKDKHAKQKEREHKLYKLESSKKKRIEKLDRKHNSYKYLHDLAWTLQSVFIRKKAADRYEMVECFTCGRKMHWKMGQMGHYWHGRLDFDLRNLKIQCAGCNKYLHGNLAIYGIKLSELLGVEGMKQLRRDAETKKYSIQELKEIIALYKKTD